MINAQKRRKNSHSINVRYCCQTHLALLILDPSFVGLCLLKDEAITLCLIDFISIGQFVSKKNIWRNLIVSQYFRLVVKMGHKPGTTLVIVKKLLCC